MDDLDFKNKVLKQYKANLEQCDLSEFEEFCGFTVQTLAIEWTIDDFSEIIRQIVLDSFSKET